MSRIAILGSGSWGTALALCLARRGDHEIHLWAHNPAIAEDIRRQRENRAYLPGFLVPETVTAGFDLQAAVAGAEIVRGAVPSQHVREIFSSASPALLPSQLLVSAAKGIEHGSFLRMTEVIGQALAGRGLNLPCAVLSGPSFAQEVAAGMPTAITIASAESGIATLLQRQFASPGLRLYTNDDVVGVELGGALKNVIALAAGIAYGLELGHNSVAALITRGIAEITRLALASGGRRETLAGLSGLGDLVLTCTGPLSRNRLVGVELGRGLAIPEILERLKGRVAEGMETSAAALGLAAKHGVEMPITRQMADILNQGKSPREALRELMARPGRDE